MDDDAGGHHGRRTRLGRRLKVAAPVAVAALALSLATVPRVTGASAASVGAYTAAGSPTSVVQATSQTYTVTIANASPPGSLLFLDKATVAVDPAFSTPAVGAAPTSKGGAWTASRTGSTITLSAVNADPLDASGPRAPSQSVSVSVTTVAPVNSGTYTWATTASYLGVASARSGSDPTVTVTGTSVTTCAPGHVCDSGTLTNNTSTVRVVTTNTSSTNETLATSYAGQVTCPNGHIAADVFTYSQTNNTATVTYTLLNTETVVPICWQSTSGTTTLSRCASASAPGPCLVSVRINDNDEEEGQHSSVVYTIRAPAGDPSGGH